jgi:hypothetical protein
LVRRLVWPRSGRMDEEEEARDERKILSLYLNVFIKGKHLSDNFPVQNGLKQ